MFSRQQILTAAIDTFKRGIYVPLTVLWFLLFILFPKKQIPYNETCILLFLTNAMLFFHNCPAPFGAKTLL